MLVINKYNGKLFKSIYEIKKTVIQPIKSVSDFRNTFLSFVNQMNCEKSCNMI